MARESDLYKKLYQTRFRGDDRETYQIFGITIGNTKTTTKVQFHSVAPVINITKSHLIVFVCVV